jgi:hypothetical protein
MKDLFMCLLLNLKNHGDITEATMYKSGVFSSIEVKTEHGTFRVNVSKEDIADEN